MADRMASGAPRLKQVGALIRRRRGKGRLLRVTGAWRRVRPTGQPVSDNHGQVLGVVHGTVPYPLAGSRVAAHETRAVVRDVVFAGVSGLPQFLADHFDVR